MNSSDFNLTKSYSSLKKPDDTIHLNSTPISDEKIFSEALWINYNRKLKDFQTYGKNLGKLLDIPSKRWGHSSLVYNNSIIIFGGRHSTRNLVNIYKFNLENLTWFKLVPLGQTPSARDSHSAIIVNFYNLINSLKTN